MNTEKFRGETDHLSTYLCQQAAAVLRNDGPVPVDEYKKFVMASLKLASALGHHLGAYAYIMAPQVGRQEAEQERQDRLEEMFSMVKAVFSE